VNAEIAFDAFWYRHINFKTVFQNTSEHAIFIQKIEKFSGEGTVKGAQPLPRPHSQQEGVPPPVPTSLRCLWRLDSSLVPLSKILNTPLWIPTVTAGHQQLVMHFP